LKAQSGDAAIRKLQGMFTDVQDESINETKQKFETYNKGFKVGPVELEVQVLNESHWPISGTQKFPLLLSQQLLNCQLKFQEFYDKNTEKKKIAMVVQLRNSNIGSQIYKFQTPNSISDDSPSSFHSLVLQ
jgi:hypothetical protein